MIADCHTHSIFSHDGHDSFDAMAEGALRAGLSILCVTDHADDCVFGDFAATSLDRLNAQVGHVLEPYCGKEDLYPAFLEAKERHAGKAELLLGVEIGGWNHDPEKGAEIAAKWPFDYILGSIHNLRGRDDFYIYDYGDGSGFPLLAADYLSECLELAEMGGFDALAHLGYFLRYMARRGISVEQGFFCCRDRLEALLRRLVEKGIALEVNTSGVFYGYPALIPDGEVFRLYRELGGELVTLGSDSHYAHKVGAGIGRAMEMLASLGYRYYTVYRERKPVMLRLE